MSNIDLRDFGLTTLEGQNIPKVVTGYFYCNINRLTSLEFGPTQVKTKYFCSFNKLTSLEFCATKIGEDLTVVNNFIINLKDIHKQFKNGYIGSFLKVQINPLKSHVLGVILIPRLKEILFDDTVAQYILNKHLKSGRDVLECQEELIQNGFKEFAQL